MSRSETRRVDFDRTRSRRGAWYALSALAAMVAVAAGTAPWWSPVLEPSALLIAAYSVVGAVSAFAAVTIWHAARRMPDADARCGACFYFDHAAGQHELRKHPAFAKVMDVLGPDQAMRAGKGDFDPETGEPRGDAHEAIRAKLGGRAHTWDQYGACTEHGELRNEFDVCESFVTIRRRR